MNLFLPFCVSFLSCGVLIFINNVVAFGQDKNNGVQKFHKTATSRLGGLALFSGFVYTLNWISFNSYTHYFLIQFLIAGIPIFLAGIIEDITHNIAPTFRLVFAIISSTLAYLLLEIKVTRTDILFFDWLLQWKLFVYILTILVITGFTHAINIIDGFNGLASGQIISMLGFLSFINYETHQSDLLLLSLVMLSITLGFFVWNWPFGKIFLGDGGAYLLGFYVVCLGLLLISRSSQVSPFAPIMLGIYPLVETLFSMYRRLLVSGHSVFQPDAIHLHSLIFRRVIKGKLSPKTNSRLSNSKVTFIFWITNLIFGGLTCQFYTNTNLLLVFFFIYLFLYIWVFNQIVRFKTPHWFSLLK